MSKAVPFVTRIDQSIPVLVGCDDTKVFQIGVTLLSMIVTRVESGVIVLRVWMDSAWLYLDISNPSDTPSPDLSWDKDASLLNLVSRLIATMGGEFEYKGQTGTNFMNDELGCIYKVKVPAEARASSQCPKMDDVADDTSILEFGTIQPSLNQNVNVQDSSEIENHKDARSRHASITLSSASRQKKALVIDDSLIVRKSIGRALERLGYKVKLAVDGMEGLKDLKETIFDITFCDFLMPNLDGFDCVEQYREWETANRRWFRQRIIGISAHASENDVNRGVQAGMDGFQEKPITVNYLKTVRESTEMEAIGKELDAILPLMADLHDVERTGLFQETPIAFSPRRTKHRRKHSGVIGKTSKWGSKVSTCLVCLADDGEEWSSYHLGASASESLCWKLTICRGSDECMQSLKSQNWDAVLVSSHLSPCSSSKTIAGFRLWESQNRVKRQSNLILLCSSFTIVSGHLPGAERVTMQPPSGFDSILCTNAEWNEFLDLLDIEAPVSEEAANMILR